MVIWRIKKSEIIYVKLIYELITRFKIVYIVHEYGNETVSFVISNSSQGIATSFQNGNI